MYLFPSYNRPGYAFCGLCYEPFERVTQPVRRPAMPINPSTYSCQNEKR